MTGDLYERTVAALKDGGVDTDARMRHSHNGLVLAEPQVHVHQADGAVYVTVYADRPANNRPVRVGTVRAVLAAAGLVLGEWVEGHGFQVTAADAEVSR